MMLGAVMRCNAMVGHIVSATAIRNVQAVTLVASYFGAAKRSARLKLVLAMAGDSELPLALAFSATERSARSQRVLALSFSAAYRSARRVAVHAGTGCGDGDKCAVGSASAVSASGLAEREARRLCIRRDGAGHLAWFAILNLSVATSELPGNDYAESVSIAFAFALDLDSVSTVDVAGGSATRVPDSAADAAQAIISSYRRASTAAVWSDLVKGVVRVIVCSPPGLSASKMLALRPLTWALTAI